MTRFHKAKGTQRRQSENWKKWVLQLVGSTIEVLKPLQVIGILVVTVGGCKSIGIVD